MPREDGNKREFLIITMQEFFHALYDCNILYGKDEMKEGFESDLIFPKRNLNGTTNKEE